MTTRTRTRTRVGLAAAALAVAAAAAGCGSRGGVERQEIFRQVTAPIAFEMMHDFPGLPVIDLRPAADFHGELGHIRGAINVPMAHLDDLLRDIAFLREQTFLVYCHSNECEPEALDYLRSKGFENAMLLHGGIEAWLSGDFGTVGAHDSPEHRETGRDGKERSGGLPF